MGRAIFHETSVFRTPASPNASREMCGGNAPPAPLEALPSTHRLARPQPRFRALPELLKRVAGAGRALPRPLPPGSAPSLPRSAPGSGGGSGLRAATCVRGNVVRGRSSRGGAEDGWDVGWRLGPGGRRVCLGGKRENPPLLPLGFISVPIQLGINTALITRGSLHA